MKYDLDGIKNKLALFGITFENYKDTTGNLTGNITLPSSLFAFNKNLTTEEAFYLVANKVYEAVNLLAMDVPNKFEVNWKQVVGDKIFNDFQTAIYEEVNQRFLSNSFPEFQNATTLTPNLMNLSSNGMSGGPNITDYLNAITKQKILNIDWLSIDPEKQWDSRYVINRMYANMSNLSLPPQQEKQVLMASEDGTFYRKFLSWFVNKNQIKDLNKQVNNNTTEIANIQSDFNNWKPIANNAATKEWVAKQVVGLPTTKQWDSSEVYSAAQFVVYDGKLFFSTKDNNLNKVPGGITGADYWRPIYQISSILAGEIVYSSGTDLKKSNTCPNTNWYINLADLEGINNIDNLFLKINSKFPDLHIKKTDAENFVKNLCNGIDNLPSFINKKLYDTKFYKGEIKFFNTIEDFKNIIGKFVNNVDANFGNIYEELADSKYLVQGRGSGTGGSNWIQLSNLPNNWLAINVGQTDSQQFAMTGFFMNGGYNGMWPATPFDAWADSFVTSYWTFPHRWNDSPNYIRRGLANRSFHLEYDEKIWMRLNRGTQQQYWPEYQRVYGVKFLKDIIVNLDTLWVNVIDIQTFYSNTETSLVLTKYYKKDEVNDLLNKKVNVLNNDQENLIPFTNNSGNLQVDIGINKDVFENINKIDSKMSANVADWTDKQVQDLAERIRGRI